MIIGFEGPIEKSEPHEFRSYSAMVDSFGVVIAYEEDKDYQGDTVFIVEADGKIGLGEFGWGSCSGCDALEAAWGDPSDCADVRNGIGAGINWFDSKEEALEHMTDEVVGGRWTRHLWGPALAALRAKP